MRPFQTGLNRMKIVTWNCAGAFRRKFAALAHFDADILVIQECEDPAIMRRGAIAADYRDFAGDSYLWVGENKNKGLGIFANNGHVLRKLRWRDRGLELFLPCQIQGQIEGPNERRLNLLAVWTKDAAKPAERYIGQLWQYLQHHKRKLSKTETVICGDFNSHVQWDHLHNHANHSDVVRQLERIGLHSLYHAAMGEPQGGESRPTFYLTKNQRKPYHIDYAFAPSDAIGAARVSVGQPADWLPLSDHMPIAFTV